MAPLAGPVLFYKAWRRGKYHESGPAMFGKQLAQEDTALWRNGCVWVHAVSVGEVMAAKAMLPLLREKFAGLPILLTTVTETGQAQARQLVPGLADAVRYYPADFSWVVRRFAEVFRPKVFIPMETELWPNALNVFAEVGARIFVLNGKISEKSFRSYSRLKSVFRGPLSGVTAFCMQTETDAERMAVMCGDRSKVFVTGNCKFDLSAPDVNEDERRKLRAKCGLPEGAKVIVVGSTHGGEEEIAIRAFRKVRARHPEAVLVLVPRHPERFEEVWRLLSGTGFRVFRLSSVEDNGGVRSLRAAEIVLVDKMGLLSQLYSIADIAVVAGSFVPGIGGHNILEAAVHSVPVVYGNYMNKQPDMLRLLGEDNGGTPTDSESLGGVVGKLLDDPGLAADKGRRGRETVLRNGGSARKNIEIISRFV